MKYSGSDDGGGIEIQADTSPPIRPCAYCRDAVEPAGTTSCPRCRAVYHPECWSANDRRCAVYGCEPAIVAPIEVVRPPFRPQRISPAPITTRSRSGNGWWIFAVILGVNGLRLATTNSSRHEVHYPPPPLPSVYPSSKIPAIPELPSADQVEALATQADALKSGASDFLRDLSGRGLPIDRAARAEIREKAKFELDALIRSRDLYRRCALVTPEQDYLSEVAEADRMIAEMRQRIEQLEPDPADR